ncbi:TIGR00730 family Rossman fold protein [Nostoc sp. CHAB 5834]|nr:TIGR00730 family Rossman fold protein [Nostoc sp. CHAB 5834]
MNNSRIGDAISRELDTAKAQLDTVKAAVSIYGGARVSPQSSYYLDAVELSRRITEKGIAVISGGGPGIMEAANRGAMLGGSARGLSIGLNIQLPFEQHPNPYQDVSVSFAHFAARKVAFCKYSHAFVVMPGGVGTLDELFEVLTLIQTGKMPEIPVLLYGAKFWTGLVSWMNDAVLAEKLISEQDLHKRLSVVDSVDETMARIRKSIPGAFY